MVARGLKEASPNGPAEHAMRLLNKHRPNPSSGLESKTQAQYSLLLP